ncbi:hypothetical protein BKA70DRAFT_1276479 [Coprinopsis sp. MPI-PUGE-AT-0042]|nr:hypothetical protein BKA70DRAFT_1276479 [Coprinopsis sp. MPI-PUGE-AT-0042]
MRFTIIAATLALAGAVAAHPMNRDETADHVARSLIAEYEEFLESRANGCMARNPSRYQGMECDIFSCQKYCVPGEKRCKWSERPKQCTKCKCQKE